MFVVRDDVSNAELLYHTSDATWQAYNDFGGNSLYTGSPAGRAYKVSYNRPFITYGNVFGEHTWFLVNEYPMIRWLERNGYSLTYISDLDSEIRGAELLKTQSLPDSGSRRIRIGRPAGQHRGGT